jgi:enoyl-[acyl-carrier-protein] reductase (NADH)
VCFLFSDWARMTSGEMIHVDGGYHAMGTDIRGARLEGAVSDRSAG